MLAVGQIRVGEIEVFLQRIRHGIQTSIAVRLIGAVLAVHAQMQVAAPRAVRLLVQAEVRQFVGEYDVDVGVHKHLVDLIRLQLPVSDIGDCLDVVAEILAHFLRHIDAILLLHDEADAAAP